MAVIFLKNDLRFQPLRTAKTDTVEFAVKVIDKENPRRTRWETQWGVQSGAGFSANRGFTDKSVRAGEWHFFDVERHKVAKCIREFGDLVEDGKIKLKVEGQPVRLKARSAA